MICKTDQLYNALNSYHQNIKLTLELLLRSSLIQKLFEVTATLQLKYKKMKKLPVHWTFKDPVRFKRNAIIGELQGAKK